MEKKTTTHFQTNTVEVGWVGKGGILLPSLPVEPPHKCPAEEGAAQTQSGSESETFESSDCLALTLVSIHPVKTDVVFNENIQSFMMDLMRIHFSVLLSSCVAKM